MGYIFMFLYYAYDIFVHVT